MPTPKAADGRIVLGCDVSKWLRPDAGCSPERLFCHVYGRGTGNTQMIPGWPYSLVAALESGRTSWAAVLDAVRLAKPTTSPRPPVRLRRVVERLIGCGHRRPGDRDILIVLDAGYHIPRPAFVLADLPVQVLGRLRSDRVFCFPAVNVHNPRGGRPAVHGPAFALSDEATQPDPAVATVTVTTCYGTAAATS